MHIIIKPLLIIICLFNLSNSYKVRVLHRSPNALNGDRRGTYCLWSKIPIEHLMLSLDVKVQDAYTGEVFFNNVDTDETWILKAMGDFKILPEKFYKVLTAVLATGSTQRLNINDIVRWIVPLFYIVKNRS